MHYYNTVDNNIGQIKKKEKNNTYCTFQAPKPANPWTGVRDAKQFGSKCVQFDLLTKTVQGSEDCLYLNVYTPNVTPDKALPVMFWIHGGAFLFGSGEDDIYGPEFLVKDGVVIVTINYRLEVLGFLCLENEDIPGNAGLKDQVAALRWVNENISQFGGDPNNITIFGDSAGGCSISYHLISPMTKGLYKRAITQSGTALCPWARQERPRDRALALAKQLGCSSEKDSDVYEFFKNQPIESLTTVSAPIVLSEKNLLIMCFSVVEEKNINDNEKYFGGDFGAVHDGVEVMVGYTADEGLVFLGPAETVQTKLEMSRDYLEVLSPHLLSFNLTSNQKLELGKKIRKHYFNDKTDISDSWEQLSNFYFMNSFVHGIVNFARLCANKGKVYLYKFTCKSERNVFAHLLGLTEFIKDKPVTCHADDLFYLFNAKLLPNKVDKKSDTFKLMERVIKLWTNFAKYG